MNACVLRNKFKNNEKPNFPARIFGYLATCEQIKQNILKVQENSKTVKNNLPFVSNITDRATPGGAVFVHWSFLKY